MSEYFPLNSVQQLEQLTELHLTGSRFFDTHTPESDWDFMIDEKQVTEEVKNILVQGEPLPRYAPKPHAVSVTRFLVNGTTVDIQVVEDIAHKLRAQQWIKQMLTAGFAYPKDKQKIEALWMNAFSSTAQEK